MSADFWAGYLSGAAGILIGNPLDLLKTRLQADAIPAATATTSPQTLAGQFDRAGTLVKGATAPIIGYGALNAILFMTYNRSLVLLGDDPAVPASLLKVWSAGALGGLATFVVSAPTELVKCRAQVSQSSASSWSIARDVWKYEGVKGLYHGGVITSIRDAVGYGFYFWSYELCKQTWASPEDSDRETAIKIMLCGGLAGIVTWTSIFPLDVIKTRVQTASSERLPEQAGLLRDGQAALRVEDGRRVGTLEVARRTYQHEGVGVFFRGLGICNIRAFIVNAVQWAVYEWMMQAIRVKGVKGLASDC
ncbi:hypothetical protein H2201_008282 [Coniosporium apollinis]|uniref:Mitochondrial thiamine pyrophosphate carrier 1 n=2 Tax=Coniosporium TaxID=2810619 RepID=A0ABQ9NGJ3_9PEZI|nr:hypothetical protein H2199_000756 [Cladosporium sp. JES 115]KAJ9657106.1 hypothetical protein H2201_008282 [Coniosporium apollinis]